MSDMEVVSDIFDVQLEVFTKLVDRVERLEKQLETNETKLNLVMDVIDQIGREGHLPMSDTVAGPQGSPRDVVAQHNERGHAEEAIANIVIEDSNGTRTLTDREEIRLFLETYGGDSNGTSR